FPGLGLVKLCIECKSSLASPATASVGNDKVHKFISEFASIKVAGGFTKGIMVANCSFTKQAREAVQAHPDVELKTVEALKHELLNAEQYLTTVIRDYRQEDI